MDVAPTGVITIILELPKFIDQVEGHPHRFVSVIGSAIRETEDGDNAFAVGGLNKSACLKQEIGGAPDKFLGRFSECSGLRPPRHIVFVGEITDHNADFMILWLDL